jgi:hypothetical protein
MVMVGGAPVTGGGAVAGDAVQLVVPIPTSETRVDPTPVRSGGDPSVPNCKRRGLLTWERDSLASRFLCETRDTSTKDVNAHADLPVNPADLPERACQSPC